MYGGVFISFWGLHVPARIGLSDSFDLLDLFLVTEVRAEVRFRCIIALISCMSNYVSVESPRKVSKTNAGVFCVGF